MSVLSINKIEITSGYYKLGIQNILFNPDSQDVASLVNNINSRQKIHIFITNWDEDALINILTCLDCAVSTISKVYIHIPKICSDLKKIIINEIDNKYKYKILIEGNNATKFSTERGIYRKCRRECIISDVPLTSDATLSIDVQNFNLVAELNMLTFNEGHNGIWKINLVNLPIHKSDFNREGVFSSKYRTENPDLFRDEIIKDFKRKTPKGIINSFINDDDIWDYIMEKNEWENTVKMKNSDGVEYNGSFEDQMKQVVGEIINEKEQE